MKVGIAQINPTVGDLAGNWEKIRAASAQALQAKVDLLVFPELALLGYPPRDLLLRPEFVRDAQEAFHALVRHSSHVPMVIGHIVQVPAGPSNRFDPSAQSWHVASFHNAAFLLAEGEIIGYQAKVQLPTFDVFDEARYFLPGGRGEVFSWRGLRLGLSVCEDLWYEEGVISAQVAGGTDLLINVSASPYFRGKPQIRWRLGEQWARKGGVPLIYANLVGAQDELIFDGRSFVIRPDGGFLLSCPAYREGLFIADLAGPPATFPTETETADVYEALLLGIRDYCAKNGISKVVIGVSGGIDSAVVTALAAEAVGKGRVIAAFLPGPFTSRISWECAQELAENLGLRLLVLSIDPVLEAFQGSLASTISLEGVVAENLQARIRGVILMALANAFDAIVLCPGNKAEIAMGYNTLYGDTVGALAPIGDLLKPEVYELARYINERAEREIITPTIMERPPTAELRSGQRDEDDLPPYSVLAPLLRAIIEDNEPADKVRQVFGENITSEALRRLWRSEYKRRQLPLVLKVSPKAFGVGWRFPTTSRYWG